MPGFLKPAIATLGGFGGGIGLFFLAFVDSSLVSLPEINDLLIIYFCTRFKDYAYFYALMATLGSVAGCSTLYWMGRWKGYGFLKRRYAEGKLERVLMMYQRYGVLALVVPALWPPPLPFKIFVLTAGIFGLSFPRFLIALLLGRGVRYFFEAAMAVRYGDRALQYVKENYMAVAVVLVAVVLAGGMAYWLVGQLRRRETQPAD